MTRDERTVLVVVAVFAALLWLLSAGPVEGNDCEPEPASIWAPAGWICPQRYGVGTASTWSGPGAASNGCPHRIRDTTGCPVLSIRSLDTGLVVITQPVEWCMCWVGVTGPNGETERLVDLSPDLVAALGLPGPGLYDVEVLPAPGWTTTSMPDTSVAVR